MFSHVGVSTCELNDLYFVQQQRPVHTTAEESEKKRFDSETASDVSVDTTPERFENEAFTGHFGFVFEENSGRAITI